MDDLALAGRIKAELALQEATSHLEFDVTSRNGCVRVRGKVAHVRDLDEVRRIAAGIPEVTELELTEP